MAVEITRRGLAVGALAGSAVGVRAQAQATVTLGVITALSGEYIDAVGPGSVVATKLAVEDFVRTHSPPFKVLVIGWIFKPTRTPTSTCIQRHDSANSLQISRNV